MVVVGAFLYKRCDVVSTFVSEHRKAGSTARVRARSVPEEGCGASSVESGVESKRPGPNFLPAGVQMESKSLSCKSCVFIDGCVSC